VPSGACVPVATGGVPSAVAAGGADGVPARAGGSEEGGGTFTSDTLGSGQGPGPAARQDVRLSS